VKGAIKLWVRLKNLRQEYLALCVIGEDTGLLIWLEFPGYSILLKFVLSGSCAPEGWTSNSYCVR